MISTVDDPQTLQLYHAILKTVQKKGPLGASSIVYDIEGAVSEATIGRILREFDTLDLTEKVSKRGRVCTSHGEDILQKWEKDLFQQRESGAFLASLDHNDVDGLLEVLEARLLLEAEITKYAALNATDTQVMQLQEIIAEQAREVEKGGDGYEQDLAFHSLLAKSSGKTVLRHALNLVRHESQLSPYIARIRKEIGGTLVSEHRWIYERIAARDPQGAEKAMESHISNLIRDVGKYFKEDSNGGG
jgi:GntR family L-lactate dehydrogenase operon transcriptional regulator